MRAPSAPRTPIRTLAGAATDRGRRVPELARASRAKRVMQRDPAHPEVVPRRNRATGVQAARRRPGEVAGPATFPDDGAMVRPPPGAHPIRPRRSRRRTAGDGRWDGWLGIAVRAERDSVLSGCAVNEELEGFLI
jgi:hypothetical protein